MLQRAVTLVVGFIIYGLLFGLILYFTEPKRNLYDLLKSAVIFGMVMSLFDVFLLSKWRRLRNK